MFNFISDFPNLGIVKEIFIGRYYVRALSLNSLFWRFLVNSCYNMKLTDNVGLLTSALTLAMHSSDLQGRPNLDLYTMSFSGPIVNVS